MAFKWFTLSSLCLINNSADNPELLPLSSTTAPVSCHWGIVKPLNSFIWTTMIVSLTMQAILCVRATTSKVTSHQMLNEGFHTTHKLKLLYDLIFHLLVAAIFEGSEFSVNWEFSHMENRIKYRDNNVTELKLSWELMVRKRHMKAHSLGRL